MQDSPGGLEEPFLLAFAHVEKRAYASEALFVTALIAGAAKADRSKLEAAALSDGGLHACQANRAADEKEVAITFGMLRGTGAGGRMVAWLERVITERNDAGIKPVLVALREAAPVRRGRVDAGETDDEMFAYATVHELAESVLTPPRCSTSTTLTRRRACSTRWRASVTRLTSSTARRASVRRTPRGCCGGVRAGGGRRAARPHRRARAQLAAARARLRVFPKGQVPTKPAELFTVHGMCGRSGGSRRHTRCGPRTRRPPSCRSTRARTPSSTASASTAPPATRPAAAPAAARALRPTSAGRPPA